MATRVLSVLALLVASVALVVSLVRPAPRPVYRPTTSGSEVERLSRQAAQLCSALSRDSWEAYDACRR